MSVRRSLKIALLLCIGLAIGVWLNNTSTFVRIPPDQKPRLLAHRGVHQIYTGDVRLNDTCTARPIAPATHGYIENTLPSMQAAFAYGADVVELDIHLTPDPIFAVFHDWTLDCRTEVGGITQDQPFAFLKTLDVGYGYTADGKAFPLRGTGVGLIPSLEDVFDAGLGGQYLINFKSKRTDEGQHLAQMLSNETYRAQVFGVYGGAVPTQTAIANTPGLRGYDKSSLKTCLKSYALVGWAGIVPAPCRDTILAIPIDFAPYLWGWPHKFTQRMKSADTAVILLGPYDGSGFSSGVDDTATLARVPEQFDGYIWTNRIEIIGPMLKQQEHSP